MNSNKRAAMEMSVGTIVTIVLLMTVLILGLVLIRTIFRGSIENIESIDEAVKNEIKKLFSEDTSRKVVIYPSSREISIKKGESGGFGFSIRNNEPGTEIFSYEVHVIEISSTCQMSETEANALIQLGRIGTGIRIPSLDTLENPILVKFIIPDTASLCDIRYGLDVEKTSGVYLPTVGVDLVIK